MLFFNKLMIKIAMFFFMVMSFTQIVNAQSCITDIERMRPDCDWDMDGVLNCEDIDDDNDGVLDTEEGYEFIDIEPAILGFSSGTNQNATDIDISTNFSLPAGTVTISFTKANIGPTGSGTLRFYDLTTLDNTEFTITSTKAAFLQINHGPSITNVGAQDRYEVDDINNYVFTGSLNTGFSETSNGNTLEITRSGGANQGGEFEWKRRDLFTGSVTFTVSSTNSGGTQQNYWFFLAIPKDTDGDTVFDAFDSDSDNDGCGDAFEAGAATTDIGVIAGPYGDNGLANSLESGNDTPTATTSYISTYTSDALDNAVNNCPECFPNSGVFLRN